MGSGFKVPSSVKLPVPVTHRGGCIEADRWRALFRGSQRFILHAYRCIGHLKLLCTFNTLSVKTTGSSGSTKYQGKVVDNQKGMNNCKTEYMGCAKCINVSAHALIG